MKRIAIEEHFATQEFFDSIRKILDKTYHLPEVIEEEPFIDMDFPFLSPDSPTRSFETVRRELLDVGAGRVADMDGAGIDVQVLSLVSPGVNVFDARTATSLARRTNDALATVVGEHPERFAGLAALAPQDPQGAADELERSVRELGLRGALINSHVKGEYLDERKYWPIWAKAQQLNVPVYIHPRIPSNAAIRPYVTYGRALAAAMSGFNAEVALHAMRLICSGVFDAYPKLQIILGHLGEGLPNWLWRYDNIWRRDPGATSLQKPPSGYFKDNFYVTTSGMFWEPPFMGTYLALGADRILFAVDYPMENPVKAVDFISAVSICDQDREKICHLNAEKLFALALAPRW